MYMDAISTSHPLNLAFSAKAQLYDAYCANNAAVQWARAQIRAEALRHLKPDETILELNAGTGEDAIYFAKQGYYVHATDVADGMVQAMREKVVAQNLGARITVQQLSFTQLDQLETKYNFIFSNFGGLNCIADLKTVTQHLAHVHQPRGYLVWVIMPRGCPWEAAQALRGHWRTATRRWRGEVQAHVEGHYFTTYYFSPAQVMSALGSAYRQVHLQSVALLSPPAFVEKFPRQWPRLFRLLTRLDERLAHYAPFNQWGDYFVLTAQRQ